MKTVALSLLLQLFLLDAGSQVLKKYDVGESGCSFYAYCPVKFEIASSEDSSTVYSGECTNDNVVYGTICIKLLRPIPVLEDAETVMESYLEYLKANFEITSAAGYGRGHTLNNDPNTRGILDHWKARDKAEWKVKAWTNGSFIGVLYAKSKKELPFNKVDIYLNGFRFPGM